VLRVRVAIKERKAKMVLLEHKAPKETLVPKGKLVLRVPLVLKAPLVRLVLRVT
jgi:hypothetical protein